MKNGQTIEFYDWGAFRLDTVNCLLWRNGKTVALTPKEYELLSVLVEHAGRVLSKDDLLARIWSDTFVEESTLTRNVSWLRKKLAAADGGDAGKKYIENVPKRGYRFSPAVRRVEKIANSSALVVEEQSRTILRVEETVTIPDDFNSLTPAADLRIANRQLEDKNPKFKFQNPKLPWLAFGALALFVICFVVYQTYFQKHHAKIIMATKVAPFSGLPGREDMPAFSPDGKQLAFSWNGKENGANVDIYVKLIGAGEPLRLTENQADDINPVFAPDGRGVAFVRVLATRNELMIVPALGGAERKTCDLRRSRSRIPFAPDGKTIAIRDGDAPSGIFLVNIESGEKKQLTAPPPKTIDDAPAFSPNGRFVAFTRGFEPLVQEIFIAPITGDEPPRQLTFDKSWIGGAAWSADGKRIIFASQRSENKQTLLWQIAADGGAPELMETGGKDFGKPTISPDGRTIAYVENSIDINIWRSQRASNANDFRKLIASSRNDHSPQLSPDGKRLVFSSNRTGGYEIWTADTDGSNERQLTDAPNFSSGSPRFSPDGRFVAYDSQAAGANDAGVFIVSADGGTPRRLTAPGMRAILPAWSADGRWIYFTLNRSGSDQLWRMSAANAGDVVQITKQGAFDSYAAPDGKTVYYSKGGGIAGLWRVSADGGDELLVRELAEAGSQRSWTIAGNGIYFVERNDAGVPFQIKYYDLTSGQIKKVAEAEKPPLWSYPGLSASANGETLFYAQLDRDDSSIIFAELGN